MTSREEETTGREPEWSEVADKTRTRINQGNTTMEVHQPHGAFQLLRLYDGVEFHSRVADQARATCSVQLTWEQAEEVRDRLDAILEDHADE